MLGYVEFDWSVLEICDFKIDRKPISNQHAFLPYGLPSNYTPPNVVHPLDENVNNSTPILIESQQTQSDHAHVSQPMGETHEISHHNLADFESRLGYTTEGQAVGGVPLPNTLEDPQFRPQPQPFHFAVGKSPSCCKYAQRWRDLAAQVVPPMTEKEMITMIVDTLSVFYYEKIVGYTPSSFADLVFTVKRIEVGLGRGKFDHPALMNKNSPQFRSITQAKVPQPPFFQGYNSNATCAYQGGVPGHSIEHCMTLKHKVQGLIDVCWLKFEENRS
ncbi:hypothetical protein HKD37_19G053141 [Glycine soja]